MTAEQRCEVLGWDLNCHYAALRCWDACIKGKERVLVLDISGTRASDLLQRLDHLPAFVHWYMCELDPEACTIRNEGEIDFRYVWQALLGGMGHEAVPFNYDITEALKIELFYLDLYDHIHFILDPNELTEIFILREYFRKNEALLGPHRHKMSIEICTYDRPEKAIMAAKRVAQEMLGSDFKQIGPSIQMLRRRSLQGVKRWRNFFINTTNDLRTTNRCQPYQEDRHPSDCGGGGSIDHSSQAPPAIEPACASGQPREGSGGHIHHDAAGAFDECLQTQ